MCALAVCLSLVSSIVIVGSLIKLMHNTGELS